ncbi:hypothetical protein [Bacillus toyonensis]|nr:hypothetical protein [Bacillus toyonensis]
MSRYARDRFSNLKVISINEKEGTFVAEDLSLGIRYSNLKIEDYFFYDFE